MTPERLAEVADTIAMVYGYPTAEEIITQWRDLVAENIRLKTELESIRDELTFVSKRASEH